MVDFLSRESLADYPDNFKIISVRILKHNKIQVVIINDSLDDLTADVPRKVSLYYYGIIGFEKSLLVDISGLSSWLFRNIFNLKPAVFCHPTCLEKRVLQVLEIVIL